MDVNTLLPDPTAVRLELIRPSSHDIMLVMRTTAQAVRCLGCQTPATRIHSRYVRQLSDLPWHGVAARIELHTRRFFCDREGCQKRIFCEPLASVVARYARHTMRLDKVLELMGFTLGGEPGARALARLSTKVSADTLLRRVRRAVLPQCATPRVLGVDDWAYRRGQSYGTIFVDLERRRVIDLLPEREAGTLSGWLAEHPGVEIISRDRSGAYADGARAGAPSAIQIADRWHLLKNLTEAVERALQSRHPVLRAAADVVAQKQISSSATVIGVGPTTMLSSREAQAGELSRESRYERYCAVMRLYKHGGSILGIAQALKMSRMTVYKYIRADGFPERAPFRPRRSRLKQYLPYIHRRWAEGCDNVRQIWREIVAQGYGGKEAMVRRYLRRLCERMGVLSFAERLKLTRLESSFQAPSARRAAWWLLKDEQQLKDEEKAFVAQLLRLSPEIEQVRKLGHDFRAMVREKKASDFGRWIESASASQVKEVEGFALKLKGDCEAVENSLCHQWSNGPVEGQVNRLKTIKRQMYGRANLDLLRARVLYDG